jgi:hypothetical protein
MTSDFDNNVRHVRNDIFFLVGLDEDDAVRTQADLSQRREE